jgi:hypothetical protein
MNYRNMPLDATTKGRDEAGEWVQSCLMTSITLHKGEGAPKLPLGVLPTGFSSSEGSLPRTRATAVLERHSPGKPCKGRGNRLISDTSPCGCIYNMRLDARRSSDRKALDPQARLGFGPGKVRH